MKLKGKAQDHFDQWFKDNYGNTQYYDLWEFLNNMPFAMQWGVYQDFFEEHGIYFGKEDFDNFFSYNMVDGYSIFYDTREETLSNVIKIYNSQNK